MPHHKKSKKKKHKEEENEGKRARLNIVDIFLLITFIILLLLAILLSALLGFMVKEDSYPANGYNRVVDESGTGTSNRQFSHCDCQSKPNGNRQIQKRNAPFKTDAVVEDSHNFRQFFKLKRHVTFEEKEQDSQCTLRKEERHLHRVKPKPEDLETKIKHFPFLVSLSEFSYNDSQEERQLACTGVVISKDWVLSGESCVQEESEWTALQVRAGSDCWSAGGSEHNVLHVVHLQNEFKGPVGIKIFPSMTLGPTIQPIKLQSIKMQYAPWKDALSPGWPRVLSANFEDRKKYEKFTVQNWSRKFCEHCATGSFDGHASCDNINTGRPLISEGVLVGLQTGVGCKKIPRFWRVPKFKERFQRLDSKEMKEFLLDLEDNLVNQAVYDARLKMQSESGAIKNESIYKVEDNVDSIKYKTETTNKDGIVSTASVSKIFHEISKAEDSNKSKIM